MNPLFHAVALAALLPVAVACGTGAKKAATTPPSVSSPGPTASATTPVAEPEPLTKKQLTSALLTSADLPAGFEKTKLDGGESADDVKVKAPNRQCEKLLQPTSGKDQKAFEGSVAETVVDYERGGTQFISQMAASFPGDTAKPQLLLADGIMTTCKRFSMSGDGLTIRFTIDKLSMPQFGDESTAYRWNGSAVGTAFIMDIVIVRVQSTVTMVMTISVGESSTTRTEQVSRKAAERLRAATPG